MQMDESSDTEKEESDDELAKMKEDDQKAYEKDKERRALFMEEPMVVCKP